MAAGDLVLGQGGGSLIGAGQGVAVAVPSSGTTTLTTNSWASLVSAVEAGNTRVKVSSGLTFTQTADLNPAGGTQLYCPDGSFTINGTSYTGSVEHLHPTGDDCFFGNIIIQNSIGQSGQGNNTATAISLDKKAYATGVYFFYCGVESNANIATMSGDEPETIDIFNGSAQGDLSRNVTFHGFYVPSYVDNTKMLTTSAGSTNTQVNTLVTFYRGYAAVHRRNPRGNDGIRLDFVNWVQPDNARPTNDMQEGFSTESDQAGVTTVVDIRGCSIQFNDTQSGDIKDNGSGAEFYYGTSGLTPTTDHSVEVGSPDLVWTGSNPFVTTRVGAYTGRPTATAMDGTLRSTILAEIAGTYAITEESPPDTLDPISGGHSTWNTMNAGKFKGFLLCKMEPYEKRFRDSIFEPFFYRWNNAAKIFVKEWTADWPGLNPHVQRGRMYIPAKTQFGGV